MQEPLSIQKQEDFVDNTQIHTHPNLTSVTASTGKRITNKCYQSDIYRLLVRGLWHKNEVIGISHQKSSRRHHSLTWDPLIQAGKPLFSTLLHSLCRPLYRPLYRPPINATKTNLPTRPRSP